MSYDLSTAEDLKGGNQLIPSGYMVECEIKVGPEKKSDNGNTMHDVELEVCKGPYTGSRFFDNIITSGNAKEWGLGKMKHIVEFTNQAHMNLQYYKINSATELSGRKALVKVKIVPHTNKEGASYLINKPDTYISPRSDSTTSKYYAAWARGEQPWQTDDKPALRSNEARSNSDFGHASQDIPFNG